MNRYAHLWPAALAIVAASYESPLAREGIRLREHYFQFGDSLAPPDTTLNEQVEMLHSEVGGIKQKLDAMETGIAPTKNKTMDERKRIKFGLSLGYRWLTGSSRVQHLKASVSPLDSTLRLTRLEGASYLFSTSMIFDLNLGSHFKEKNDTQIIERKAQGRSGKSFRGAGKTRATKVINGRRLAGKILYHTLDRLCLVSNLNLLDFSSGQKELAFNKSIEGGLGIGYRINESMFVGLNWEHVQSWQLYDDIKEKEGEKIILNGLPLVSSNQLDTDNEDLYYKKNLNGWSFKMIIAL